MEQGLKAGTLLLSKRYVACIAKLYAIAVLEKEEILKRKTSYENYKDSHLELQKYKRLGYHP